jgi:hypothetical protein
MSRYPVAALYVDPSGHYPDLAFETWDKVRDARKYRGPLPVVAHPPCQQWSRLRSFATVDADEAECGLIAVGQVRLHGGVLEHPQASLLWSAAGLPVPGGIDRDEWGGWSIEVAQGDYGHSAPKLTWLYMVGVEPFAPRMPTLIQRGRVELMSRRQRIVTPVDFAHWLCQLASGAAR